MDIRPASLDDAPRIAAIYNREVLESTVTFDIEPRTLAEQEAWLRDRSGVHAVLVAEVDGVVAGFASLSPYRDRAAYRTSVEDSVYLDRDYQGQGIGRVLLVELLELATRHGFHAVFAKVVGGHEASIRLHEALGFQRVGTEREVGRKFGRWLDVELLQKLL
ncbi:MAG: GNAT family N-acetyltransferase [Acidimicrobiia bacterium]|nr:GNAT family N-acetyltransferase [Acidimicrobiia bacterium]MDH5237723.1 GNAT family N-acetyltransferase [Acidimicrobiia bacterium]